MDQQLKPDSFLERLFLADSDQPRIQLFRYSITGGTTYLIEFLFFFTFYDMLRIPYVISTAMAFTIGVTLVYMLSIQWVFQKGKHPKKEVGVFVITGIIGILIHDSSNYILQLIEASSILAWTVSNGALFFWNFLSRRELLKRS